MTVAYEQPNTTAFTSKRNTLILGRYHVVKNYNDMFSRSATIHNTV